MLILGNLLWHTTGAGAPPPPPPPPAVSAVQPSGGFPSYEGDRGRTRRDISEARKRLDLEDGFDRALPVINFVAARQVERLETDQQKIFEELLRELELERITFDRRYLDALNLERQRLITEEIARRLKAGIEEGELMLLLLVAAAAA